MRKLLWVGDAIAATGFSKVTHKALEYISKSWEVNVLGINYYGEPHDYPYKIYPCVDPYRGHRSIYGADRLPELVQSFGPDLIVIQNDHWNIHPYLALKGDVKTMAVIPVDGKNVQGQRLNGLDHAVFWTHFGAQEAAMGGYKGPASVIPLGVDTQLYQPIDQPKRELRRGLSLPERLHDAFIVGNVNRNQPRKRMDLTISFFCEWVKEYDIPDAHLYLHAAPTGEHTFDVGQLMAYYGLASRLVMFVPDVGPGIPEYRMPYVYNTFDMQITTTQGEGWGLTTLEGMACGVPQVVPDWAALGEWTDPASRVRCSEIACTMNTDINVIGGVPDRTEFIHRMDSIYHSEGRRKEMIDAGIQLALQPEYNWNEIGSRYLETVNQVFESPVLMPTNA